MVSTLDTNIVVYAALRQKEEQEEARDFLSQSSRFLSPQVKDEVLKIEERITAFQMFLTANMEEDKTPFDAFEEIEKQLTGGLKTRLNSYFRNIAKFYDKQYERGRSIEQITEDLLYQITVYSSIDKIRPTQETLQQNVRDAEKYEGVIEDYDLVDREDSNIIVQLQLFQDMRGGSIELVSLDDGFRTEKEEWENNFPNISVRNL